MFLPTSLYFMRLTFDITLNKILANFFYLTVLIYFLINLIIFTVTYIHTKKMQLSFNHYYVYWEDYVWHSNVSCCI